MNIFHEEHYPKKIKVLLFAFSLLLAGTFFFCVIPYKLHAQQLGSVITYQESIASDEEGGRLFSPSFVFADPFTDETYIIDGKGRVIVFNAEFFPVHTLSKRDGIVTPQGLTVDADGNVYIAQSPSDDNEKSRISVYNGCLKWERDIYLHGFKGAESFTPYRLIIDKKGNFIVAASYYAGVLYVDRRGGLIEVITPEENNKEAIITNVIQDKQGRIYLVSEEQGRIYVYDEERKFIMKFGEKGGSSGKLSRPRGLGVDDRNGRMYVVDYMRHTINVYDKEGQFIFEFGGLGWSEGWFQHPIDLAIDNQGRILVADMFNQRVQIFNSF